MTQISRLILFISLIVLSGCSSSDDSGNIVVPNTDSFAYSYDSEIVNISSWQAIKVENRIVVTGSADDGRVFATEFNKFGNLSSANSYSISDFKFPTSISFEYFKSNYFNFELVDIDEINKRVSVVFSGNLYEDDYDINSTTHFVEGSFSVGY